MQAACSELVPLPEGGAATALRWCMDFSHPRAAENRSHSFHLGQRLTPGSSWFTSSAPPNLCTSLSPLFALCFYRKAKFFSF